MLDKTFDAKSVEPRIHDLWMAAGAFRAGAGAKPGAEAFTVVIPPPNVTGSLHMGHALNNTLQDVLVRFERMRGKNVLWQPGTDHAGIATQMVVERQLAAAGKDRRTLANSEAESRRLFLDHVWAWKEKSGGTIVGQLHRLGASADWSRERFTMDEGLSRAVTKVFVQLHREGLIYKDKRLVNWDPKLLTAISDLEVQQTEVKGHLWHFRYPLEGKTFDSADASTFIVVATTRPETMLGDTAVAVNPTDERYKHLIGKHVILPLVGRRIPIVGDDYADPEAGSGAVKITPAHDFNDFEVGRRHHLPQISVMDTDARMDLDGNSAFWNGLQRDATVPNSAHARESGNPAAGADASGSGSPLSRGRAESVVAALHGLDRFEARKRVVALLDAGGCLAKVEPHTHAVPHGDRSGVPIEPYLTEQWYVDAKTLAQPAIAAVRGWKTVFVPQNWEKTYFEWLENIQPWCISRQLWWGHQIPAWYAADGTVFVEESEDEAVAKAIAHLVATGAIDDEAARALIESGRAGELVTRDEDVLDTWFSSALWPFSTLGWPDQTPELATYYPTSVLVTGFDIIFFWVARMMMLGLHFMKEVPFRTVYIHALVRDEKGRKMSKTLGNVIDPLVLIEEYGADALRLTLTAMAAQGRDIKLAPARVGGYRNFGTKLWNSVRFAEMNGCRRAEGFDPAAVREAVNQWIVARVGATAKAATDALEAYRFNDAANALYAFVWADFCDWYLELAKPILTGTDEAAKAETRATTAYVLDQALRLLHPVMPFMTEELWQRTADWGPAREPVLALAQWPALDTASTPAAEEIAWLIGLITAVRSVRAELNVPPVAMLTLVPVAPTADVRSRLERHAGAMERLARIREITPDASPDQVFRGTAQIAVDGTVYHLTLAGHIDIAAERARLGREAEKIRGEIARIDKKLGNAEFVARAPEEVIEADREKRAEYVARLAAIEAALARLAGV